MKDVKKQAENLVNSFLDSAELDGSLWQHKTADMMKEKILGLLEEIEAARKMRDSMKRKSDQQWWEFPEYETCKNAVKVFDSIRERNETNE